MASLIGSGASTEASSETEVSEAGVSETDTSDAEAVLPQAHIKESVSTQADIISILFLINQSPLKRYLQFITTKSILKEFYET
jgi:hypothetical protein